MTIFLKNLLIAGSFLVIIFFVSLPYLTEVPVALNERDGMVASFFDEKVKEEMQAELEAPSVDISGWKTYQSKSFGFEVKYPGDWEAPIVKKASRGDKWEYRYFFRKKELSENDSYAGFYVAVYNKNKVKEILNSEEFPLKKNEGIEPGSPCSLIDGNLSRHGNFPLEEVNILSDNKCFNPALFYGFSRGQYAYNIIPMNKDEEKINIAKEDVLQNFPEFFSVAANFNLTEIKIAQAVRRIPIITAPKPTAPTKMGPGGKRVCAKKGDDPSKSDQNKKKHMDMECCLDPDEIPNPHCYYSPRKYGKYLK